MPESCHLSDLFAVSERFHRSVNISMDFPHEGSLSGYVATRLSVTVLDRIIGGLRAKSGNRAWVLAGPYGAGKSACMLFLGQALGYPVRPKSRELLHRAAPDVYRRLLDCLKSQDSGYVVVPIVASRQPLAMTILDGLGAALAPFADSEPIRDVCDEVSNLRRAFAADAILTAPVAAIVERAALIISESQPNVHGLILILDELGRGLEYAALYPEQGDVELLQSLAEAASRSDTPTVALITVLHQAFEYYASLLSSAQQRDWSKVKGRFEEIGFLESPAELLHLIGQAILPQPGAERLAAAIRGTAAQASKLDLLPRGLDQEWSVRALSACAPLHPTVALLLGPLFRSRLAQNERSLFAFLSSGEPNGFQEHLAREECNGNGQVGYYRSDHLYDYLVSALGSSLYLQTQGKRWAEIDDALDRLPAEATELHARLVKSVGLFGLVGDQRSLRASDEVLCYTFCDAQTSELSVRNSLKDLVSWRIAIYRSFRDAYSLWEGSDVDLDACYERAIVHLGHASGLAELLNQGDYLRPLIAKRHFHETGTLRYLVPRVIDVADADEAARSRIEGADGLLLYVLPSAETALDETLQRVAQLSADLAWPQQGQVLFAVPRYFQGIRETIQDLRAWDWVRENTPELDGDSIARRELAARRMAARSRLDRALKRTFEPSEGHQACGWIWRGEIQPCPTRGALARLVSKICDHVYYHAPVVKNEIINRHSLSSAGAAARRSLVDRMLSHGGEIRLGLQGYPPEMSVYLSVLDASGLHQNMADGWGFGPPAEIDPGRVGPLWRELESSLADPATPQVPVTTIYERLRQPPFGIRDGLLPVYLVAFMAYGQHEIALYEEGTFVPEVGIAELERLLRVPERFSLQRYPLDRQRLRLLTGYLRLFSPSVAEEQVLPLNAVRSLIAFARSLPRYALATDSVGDKGKAVCQVLVTARDPNALLYQSLPEAVGYDALVSDDAMESYLSDLRRVLLTLSDAYRKLLEQVEHDLYDALRAPQDADIGRQLVTERARRLVDSVDDLRLGAFLGRLADAALPQDEWLESVAAVLANRPPAQWSDGDYRRFRVAVWQLAGQLSRLEDIVLSSGADEHASVVRFGITDRYGRELREVLHVTQEDEETVTAATKALLDRLLALGLDSRLEMAALARLAADLMHDTGESTSNG